MSMSADESSAETPPVGEALVAALGFEPTDGNPTDDGGHANGGGNGRGATNGESDAAVFATTTLDVEEPEGFEMDEGELEGSGEPTAETAAVQSAEPEGDLDDDPGLSVDDVLDDVSSAANGHQLMAEAEADDTVRVEVSDDLFDSSGIGSVAPTDLGAEPHAEEQMNGFATDEATAVAPGPGGISSGPPLMPPTVEESQQIPVPGAPPVGMPMTADEALAERTPDMPDTLGTPVLPGSPGLPGNGAVVGGAAVARGEMVSRQGGLSQISIGDRVGDVAARLPQIFEEGLRQRPRRVRARKVRRVVRHVDPWSMLTFSVLFHLCVFAAFLLASVLVWNAAVAAGTIENIEQFIRDLGDYRTFEIDGDVVFRAAMAIAGILTLASSLMVVLLTVVFNLISDLVGGIRVTVIEEETVRVRRRSNQ
ncbi:MAG: DUF3566 domain-containing protein [Actinomycetota bacterium]